MADAPVFTPAHKVVIDAATFLVARIREAGQDDHTDLAFKALGDVLPGITPSGNAVIDRLTTAAAKARDLWLAPPKNGWAQDWLLLSSGLADAVADFAWARLAQSHHALFPEGVAT